MTGMHAVREAMVSGLAVTSPRSDSYIHHQRSGQGWLLSREQERFMQ